MYHQVPLGQTFFTHPSGRKIVPVATFKNESGEILHILVDNDCYVICTEVFDHSRQSPIAAPTPFIIGEVFEVLKRLPSIKPALMSSSLSPRERMAEALSSLQEGSEDAESVEAALFLKLSDVEVELLRQALHEGPTVAGDPLFKAERDALVSLGLAVHVVHRMKESYLAGTPLGRRVFVAGRLPSGL